MAVILQDGINRMYGEKQEDVFYYITIKQKLTNNQQCQRRRRGIIRKGLYKFETVEAKGNKGHVQL